MITWLSTKSPHQMLDIAISPEVSEYLFENQGIDAAILASDLGLSRSRVQKYQRRLGLRQFAVRKRPKPCSRICGTD